jgi:hypothetical protein
MYGNKYSATPITPIARDAIPSFGLVDPAADKMDFGRAGELKPLGVSIPSSFHNLHEKQKPSGCNPEGSKNPQD